MASYLINQIPQIEDKKYLEIGVYQKSTFNAVRSAYKVCVDPEQSATFQMTSDEFFRQNNENFDVVYIDGCHDFLYVLRDLNNSLSILNPGGAIFLHDLFPLEEYLTAPHFCGTAYKLLLILRDTFKHIWTQDSDYGLTFIFSPSQCEITSEGAPTDYYQFRTLASNVPLYSREEMQSIVRKCYG